MKTTFKFFVFTIFHLLIFSSAYCQAPQAFPYQAVARNASGNILANQLISLRFSIIDSVINGAVLYKEVQTATTNSLGLFNVNIGQGVLVSGSFSTIKWGTNSKFIRVEMDATGGVNYITLGTSQLMSVPYAINAKTTSSFPNGTAVGNTPFWNGTEWENNDHTLYNDGNDIGIGTTTPSYKLDVVHSGFTGIRSKSTSSYSVVDIDGASGDAALRFMNAGTTKWNMRNNPSTNNLQILRNNNSSLEAFTIENSSGFIGINKPDPAEQLDVTGNIHTTGKLVVETNKGIVRSDNGTQLKTVLYSGGIAFSLPAGGTLSFGIAYTAFSSTPTISVGNISGTLVHPEFILYTVRNADTDSATIDIYNAGTSTASVSAGTFHAIIIGAE